MKKHLIAVIILISALILCSCGKPPKDYLAILEEPFECSISGICENNSFSGKLLVSGSAKLTFDSPSELKDVEITTEKNGTTLKLGNLTISNPYLDKFAVPMLMMSSELNVISSKRPSKDLCIIAVSYPNGSGEIYVNTESGTITHMKGVYNGTAAEFDIYDLKPLE